MSEEQKKLIKETVENLKQPDTYDRVVAKAFWFVVGFSIALMICCIAFGQTLYA